MKILTDEDYNALLGWSAGWTAKGYGDVDRFAKLRERYTDPPELFVVELDDPNSFPTPTWGPFAGLADAEGFVAKLLRRKYVAADDFAGWDIVRSYQVDGGIYYHIKRLQPPTD